MNNLNEQERLRIIGDAVKAPDANLQQMDYYYELYDPQTDSFDDGYLQAENDEHAKSLIAVPPGRELRIYQQYRGEFTVDRVRDVIRWLQDKTCVWLSFTIACRCGLTEDVVEDIEHLHDEGLSAEEIFEELS
jgi:hypothetical protein